MIFDQADPPARAHDASGIFLRALSDAAATVALPYIQHPYLDRTRAATRRSCERVYCYELYHQLRLSMERSHDPAMRVMVGGGYALSAELDKRLSYLDTSVVPDFLWHVPGAEHNAVVVEVKRSDVSLRTLRADLKKIADFMAISGYLIGLLVVFGDGPDEDTVLKLKRSARRKRVALLIHRAGHTPELWGVPERYSVTKRVPRPRNHVSRPGGKDVRRSKEGRQL